MFTLMWFGCAALNFACGNVLLGGLCAVNGCLNPVLGAVFGDPDGEDE